MLMFGDPAWDCALDDEFVPQAQAETERESEPAETPPAESEGEAA